MPSALPILIGIVASAAGASTLVTGLLVAGASILSGFMMKKTGSQSQSRGLETQINQSSTRLSIPIVYGTRLVGTNDIYVSLEGQSNDTLWLVCGLCEGEIDSIAQDEQGNYLIYLDDKLIHTFGSNAEFHFYNGSPDQEISIISEYGDNNKNLAVIIFKLVYNSSLFSSLPARTIVIKGRKIWDPRTDETVWSDNPALCLLDFLLNTRFGLAKELEYVDIDSFIFGANYCDDMGFKLNYYVDGNVTAQTIQDDILRHMRGMLIKENNILVLQINDVRYETPVLVIDDSMIVVGDDEVTPQIGLYQPALNDIPTHVKVSFIDKDAKWTTDELIIGVESYNPQSIELPGCTDRSMAANLGVYYLERFQLCRTINVMLRDDAIVLSPGDLVTLSTTEYEISNQLMRVISVGIQDTGLVSVNLQYEALELYDKEYNLRPGEIYEIDLPDPFDKPPSCSGFATEQAYTYRDKTFIRLFIDWSYPVGYPWVDHVDVYIKTETTDWYYFTNAKNDFWVDPVQEKTTYYIKLLVVNTWGVAQNFDDAFQIGHYVGGIDLYYPPPPNRLYAIVNVNSIILWSKPISYDNLRGYVWRVGDDGYASSYLGLSKNSETAIEGVAPGSHTWWINTIGENGLVSFEPKSVSTFTEEPPLGYEIIARYPISYVNGDYSNTESFEYASQICLRATRNHDSFIGKYWSGTIDLGSNERFLIYTEGDIIKANVGKTWEQMFPEPMTWEQIPASTTKWRTVIGTDLINDKNTACNIGCNVYDLPVTLFVVDLYSESSIESDISIPNMRTVINTNSLFDSRLITLFKCDINSDSDISIDIVNPVYTSIDIYSSSILRAIVGPFSFALEISSVSDIDINLISNKGIVSEINCDSEILPNLTYIKSIKFDITSESFLSTNLSNIKNLETYIHADFQYLLVNSDKDVLDIDEETKLATNDFQSTLVAELKNPLDIIINSLSTLDFSLLNKKTFQSEIISSLIDDIKFVKFKYFITDILSESLFNVRAQYLLRTNINSDSSYNNTILSTIKNFKTDIISQLVIDISFSEDSKFVCNIDSELINDIEFIRSKYFAIEIQTISSISVIAFIQKFLETYLHADYKYLIINDLYELLDINLQSHLAIDNFESSKLLLYIKKDTFFFSNINCDSDIDILFYEYSEFTCNIDSLSTVSIRNFTYRVFLDDIFSESDCNVRSQYLLRTNINSDSSYNNTILSTIKIFKTDIISQSDINVLIYKNSIFICDIDSESINNIEFVRLKHFIIDIQTISSISIQSFIQKFLKAFLHADYKYLRINSADDLLDIAIFSHLVIDKLESSILLPYVRRLLVYRSNIFCNSDIEILSFRKRYLMSDINASSNLSIYNFKRNRFFLTNIISESIFTVRAQYLLRVYINSNSSYNTVLSTKRKFKSDINCISDIEIIGFRKRYLMSDINSLSDISIHFIRGRFPISNIVSESIFSVRAQYLLRIYINSNSSYNTVLSTTKKFKSDIISQSNINIINSVDKKFKCLIDSISNILIHNIRVRYPLTNIISASFCSVRAQYLLRVYINSSSSAYNTVLNTKKKFKSNINCISDIDIKIYVDKKFKLNLNSLSTILIRDIRKRFFSSDIFSESNCNVRVQSLLRVYINSISSCNIVLNTKKKFKNNIICNSDIDIISDKYSKLKSNINSNSSCNIVLSTKKKFKSNINSNSDIDIVIFRKKALRSNINSISNIDIDSFKRKKFILTSILCASNCDIKIKQGILIKTTINSSSSFSAKFLNVYPKWIDLTEDNLMIWTDVDKFNTWYNMYNGIII